MSTPNLLVILSDEHQGAALSCAGHFAHTPNLDALAARGMRYTNAYTPSPICVPARAAFATGQYPHQIRYWDNAMPYTGTPKGWGHALQERGVPVESIGKLHYRYDDDDAGFDLEHLPMQVVGGHGMVWASIRGEDDRVSPMSRMLGPEIGPGESDYTRYDRAVTARTVEWLSNAPDKPWCLYVGLVAPHFPLVCPEEFYALYPEGSVPEPKLHPRDGHPRHPWVEKQNAFMDSETKFADEAERQRALRAYYGLVSFTDANVGSILAALDGAGLTETTRVIYSSDHGDNAGARGLWGKSTMYEESTRVPMIMAGPDVPVGIEAAPTSLLDISQTIATQFADPLDGPGRDLQAGPPPSDGVVFSEYHAAGAVSGAFMLRKGRWKLVRYIGFEDELFDLEADPEELASLAGDPAYAEVLQELRDEMAKICDIEAVNAQAFADQAALIEHYGGREKALTLGAPGATPAPKV